LQKEIEIDRLVRNKAGISFTNWEFFIRNSELNYYQEEKSKRDEIYKMLKNKISELKKDNPKEYKKMLKTELFGSQISVYKIRSDSLIPPQHHFNLYLKAIKSEAELDQYYIRQNRHFEKLISSTKHQVDILKKMTKTPRRFEVYESRNFKKYYDNYSELQKIVTEESSKNESARTKEEEEKVIKKYELYKAMIEHEKKSMINIGGEIKIRLKEKGIDLKNMKPEEYVSILDKIFTETQKEIILGENHFNDEFLINNKTNPLSISERKAIKIESLKEILEMNEKRIDEFQQNKNKHIEDELRNEKYFELVKRHKDRQVRKNNKPDLSDIEKYGDVEKLRRI
jgi:hypothetical protein